MDNLQPSAAKDLQRIVDQVERLQSEQKGLGQDISDKLKEAKNKGFDVGIIRKILALRKKSASEREEEEALIAVYAHALGMSGTPLGDFADRQHQAEGIAATARHAAMVSL